MCSSDLVLVNVGGFLNGEALNIPIEGVAALLLGDGSTVASIPPFSAITPASLLATLLVPALWIAGSYRSIRRWQRRGALPPHGIHRVRMLYLPLIIDTLPVAVAWIIVPAQFHTPMGTIALFAPDVFATIAILTGLCIGWAVIRAVLVLRPRKLPQDSGRHAENGLSLSRP